MMRTWMLRVGSGSIIGSPLIVKLFGNLRLERYQVRSNEGTGAGKERGPGFVWTWLGFRVDGHGFGAQDLP